MEHISIHAFDGLTGAHRSRLPCSAASWQDSINEPGSMTATVPDCSLDIPAIVQPYGCIVAAIGWGRVLHAGYVQRVNRDDGAKQWSITAGGGMSVLDKRLVLNRNLMRGWRDGTVVIDEANPKGNWPLTVNGSYSDLISRLIRETEAWGALPITPAALTGGDKTRTYNSYDLATVSDRIKDIGNLENGPEFRFDPRVSEFGVLTFEQVTSTDGGELIDNRWVWNALVPESGVVLGNEDADGTDMCTQSFGTGGKTDDKLLVARSTSSSLTSKGWPVLQIANTSHSSVSQLSTLKSYVNADVRAGDDPQRTIGLQVDMERYAVHVGDWANVRRGTGEGDVLLLKVTDVSGGTDSRMATLQCRERA